LITFVEAYHWNDVKNRRAALENYAKTKGFDPLVAKNWYKLKPTDLVVLFLFIFV
jgi:hypothetical protein